MAVVNVKVANIRPKYSNLDSWMKDDNNVYIGRAGIVFINGERFPKKSSIWHNPFKIGSNETREMVIKKYEVYITEQLMTKKIPINRLLELKNKNLGCWCTPLPCHGDVLLSLLDRFQWDDQT